MNFTNWKIKYCNCELRRYQTTPIVAQNLNSLALLASVHPRSVPRFCFRTLSVFHSLCVSFSNESIADKNITRWKSRRERQSLTGKNYHNVSLTVVVVCCEERRWTYWTLQSLFLNLNLIDWSITAFIKYHSYFYGCWRTININKCKKLTSLKIIVRTMCWCHSTKTAKSFG